MSKFTDQTTQDQKASEAGNTDNTAGDQPFAVIGDRVFQTKEDALKSLTNAQEHIQRLEQEAAERKQREEAEANENQSSQIAKEVLEQIKAQQANSRKDDQTDQSSKAELNKDELKALIQEELSTKFSEAEKDRNSDLCVEAAKEVFGDSYNAKIAEKAKTLGMSVEDANRMAENSPAAFKELFIPKQQTQSTSFSANADQSTQALRDMENNGNDQSFSVKGKNSTQIRDVVVSRMKEAGLYD